MPETLTDQLSRARSTLLAELAPDVRDRRVLEAMARVPRERFLAEDLRLLAYENRPLPIGYGQTISQPLIVALMVDALALTGSEKVLEVGTGSGYQAAVLGRLAARVVTVELIPPLAQRAAQRLADLGYTNVSVYVAGEELGWPAEAPYDAIIVAAGAPEVPQSLIGQLALGGRLVVPVGSRDLQELTRVVRTAEGSETARLGPCRFVPLLGRGAWLGELPS